LSLRRDLLPDEYALELRRLQDHAGPFPGSVAIKEIELGLGRPLAEIYEEFDEAPFAAGSIGQVHRARLEDGTEVIVKVRRPGIRAQIDADMRILLAIGRVLLVLVPGLQRLRPLQVVEESWIG
jgi:ubiquinone biosynthesis protein